MSAAGTRLRRRLSKSFHCESADSGFLSRRCPGRARAAGASPRAASRRESSGAGGHVGAVGRRIFFVQLRVAQKSRPGVATFDEVVTQDPVVGKAVAQRLLERVDVVDPLADEKIPIEQPLPIGSEFGREGVTFQRDFADGFRRRATRRNSASIPRP